MPSMSEVRRVHMTVCANNKVFPRELAQKIADEMDLKAMWFIANAAIEDDGSAARMAFDQVFTPETVLKLIEKATKYRGEE